MFSVLRSGLRHVLFEAFEFLRAVAQPLPFSAQVLFFSFHLAFEVGQGYLVFLHFTETLGEHGVGESSLDQLAEHGIGLVEQRGIGFLFGDRFGENFERVGIELTIVDSAS